jgi:hypothetical protein
MVEETGFQLQLEIQLHLGLPPPWTKGMKSNRCPLLPCPNRGRVSALPRLLCSAVGSQYIQATAWDY